MIKWVIILSPIVFGWQSVTAQISATKHNLSVSGSGTIKAASEQQICKFCHIPHKASPTVPLWDHTMSAVSYSTYTSSTLTATYVTSFPNASSKLCLSCHDGTIAIGATIRGQFTVSGGALLDPDQSLAASAASNIGGATGATLTDDHPISIGAPHFNSTQYNCSGCHYPRPSDIVPLECVSCHDPHNETKDATTKKFLKQSNSSSALCLTCHNKVYWSTNPSIHQSSTKAMPAGLSHNGYATVATNGCESCHKPHSAANASRLTKASEEGICTPCHRGIVNGGITEKNVSNATGGPFAKTYTHPTYTRSGKHNPVNASPSTNSPNENSADVSGANRHAECQDCHNPHAAKSGLHTTQSNAASSVLLGNWGNEPTDPATKWTQPTTFTRVDPATKEFQICMKCHSSYGLGLLAAGVSTVIGPSGSNITDQAWEYNVNNLSAHPVKVGLSSQTGSVAPKPLFSTQMTASWNAVGTQTMYCSDCHGNDQTVSATVPDGPHGSNRKFMLKGTNQYWPTKSDGTTLWALDDFTTSGPPLGLFCANCHPMKSGTTWQNNVHMEHARSSLGGGGQLGTTRVPCVTCHVVVPHGSKRGRLIGYSSDIAPYKNPGAGLNTLVLIGFKKAASSTNYGMSDCYSTQSNCNAHTNAGGYDQ